MKTQFDSPVRVVTVENLIAMCAEVSGIACDTFHVSSISRSRVHVQLSGIVMLDPESGVEETSATVGAVFPSFPNEFNSQENALNPYVVMHPLRFLAYGDRRFADRGIDIYQLFQPLFDCPRMFRIPQTQEWVAAPPEEKK